MNYENFYPKLNFLPADLDNYINRKRFKSYRMETITIPKEEFEQMKEELIVLRNSKIYQRLLAFEKNIMKIKKTRKDLGF